MSITRGRLLVVVGGQFGSEGKGHLTAQIAAQAAPESLVIRTGGPNAGHTVWADDTEYKLRHLPTPIAVRPDIRVALAARSVVDPRILREEIDRFPGREVLVDPAATILEPGHIETEQNNLVMGAIGSTRKGIGEARAARIGRAARTAHDLWGDGGTEADIRILTTEVADLAYATIARGADVIVEAAQGYGLGLHTDFYPYTTSADCTAIDALADARISPWTVGVTPMVWMAVRPYPIRVAGTSGPLRYETSWAELGLPVERTTVTNKVRRVGLWDGSLVRRAALANGCHRGHVRIGLLMADQVEPELAGVDEIEQFMKVMRGSRPLSELINMVSIDSGVPVGAIGTGPRTMVFARNQHEGF